MNAATGGEADGPVVVEVGELPRDVTAQGVLYGDGTVVVAVASWLPQADADAAVARVVAALAVKP